MTEDLRLRNNHIQTPIAELAHPATGGTVGLIATLHFGMPSYFAQLGDYIAARESAGAAVHCEGVRNATSEAVLQGKAAKTYDLLAPRLDPERMYLVAFIKRELDLVHQYDGLRYTSTWQNHDLNRAQLAQHEHGRAFTSGGGWPMRVINGITRAIDVVTPPPVKPHVAGFLYKSVMFGESFPDSIADEAVHTAREEVAIEAVQAELSIQPDRDIVMIWGCGHMRGLTDKLGNLGYGTTDMQWLDAVRLPGKHNDID